MSRKVFELIRHIERPGHCKDLSHPDIKEGENMQCEYCKEKDVQVDRDGLCRNCSEGIQRQEERKERGESREKE